MTLPSVTTEDEIVALKKDPARSLALLRGVGERCGLDPSALECFATGSQVIGANATQVLKVFPAFDAEHARTEARVLAFLSEAQDAGRLPVATPRLESAQEIDGWHAVVMERLPGAPLAARVPSAEVADPDEAALRSLCREAGAWLAALHALDPAPLADLPPAWGPWIEGQRERAVERQRGLGLDEPWLAQIEPFLAETDADRTAHQGAPVLLHTEMMRDHLLARRGADGAWHLSGVIDFEPAMVGAASYDLASVGLFVSAGDRTLLGAFLDGYGLPAADRGPALARRVLASALLHRYAHLPWYLSLPAAEGVTDLDELAARLFLAG